MKEGHGLVTGYTASVPPMRRRLLERIGTAWADRAACRGMDTEAFYPIGSGPAASDVIRAAQRVCARCPVVHQCLQYALLIEDDHGIWGGLTPDQRRALRAGIPLPGEPVAGPEDGTVVARRRPSPVGRVGERASASRIETGEQPRHPSRLAHWR